MRLDLVDTLIWTVGSALELSVLLMLCCRHMLRRFRWLSILLAFLLLRSVVLVGVVRFASSDAYFYTYYVGTGIEYLLRGPVLLELIQDALAPKWLLPRSTVPVFMAVATVGIAFAWHLTSDLTLPDQLWLTIRRMEWSACFATSLVFVTASMYRWFLFIPLKELSLGFLDGFGIAALLSLLINALRFHPDLCRSLHLSQLYVSTWILAYLWWLVHLTASAAPELTTQTEEAPAAHPAEASLRRPQYASAPRRSVP